MSTTPTTRSRGWRALWRDDDARRLVALLATGVLAALVTGEQGNQNDYLASIRGSLTSIRLPICLALAVVLWLTMRYTRRHGAGPASGLTGRAAAMRERVTNAPGARSVALLVILAVAIGIPPLLSDFWREVLVTQTGIYILLAVGLNVVVGLAGLLDLGYIAFFAIGAYTTAYLTGRLPVSPPFTLNEFYVIAFAVLACLIAGVILGAPTLRLRGDYLAIVTLGFGEIIYLVAINADEITGGASGAKQIPHPSLHIGPINFDWHLAALPYWYLLVVFISIVVFFFHRLENSNVGRAWAAIREDEVAAQATGLRTIQFKLLAFAIGASTSGVAGVIYAGKVGFINPQNFILQYSIFALAYVIFGGMGSLPGVIMGASVLTILPALLRSYVPDSDRPIYLGAVLVIMMIFRPVGMVAARRRKLEIAEGAAGPGAGGSPPEPAPVTGAQPDRETT